LDSTSIGCARWRTYLSVNPAEAKPRTIGLKTEFAADGCCKIHPTGFDQVAELRRRETLRFDPGRRTYR